MSERRDFGFWVLLLLGLLLVAGLFWTPHDPMAQVFISDRLAGSSFENLMGVDGLGRDFLSRVWRGGGNTFLMGISAMVAAVSGAVLLLVLERSGPSILRRQVRRVAGVWIAIPVLFVGLLLLVFLDPSPGALVVAVSAGLIPLGFRQLRIFWLEQIGAEYVRASVVLGAGRSWLFRRVLWPNLRGDVAALLRLLFALAVLELSGLAFLGLVGDPDFPELGALLRENQRYLFQRPMLLVWPGLVLTGLLFLIQLTGLQRK